MWLSAAVVRWRRSMTSWCSWKPNVNYKVSSSTMSQINFGRILRHFYPNKPLVIYTVWTVDIWYLPLCMLCESRLVSAVDKQITDSTYVCLPHLLSGKLFSSLGSQTLCAQVFGRPGARNENQVLFLAHQFCQCHYLPLRVLWCDLPSSSFVRWAACMISNNSGQWDLRVQRWLGKSWHLRHQRLKPLPVLPETMAKMQCPKWRLGKKEKTIVHPNVNQVNPNGLMVDIFSLTVMHGWQAKAKSSRKTKKWATFCWYRHAVSWS